MLFCIVECRCAYVHTYIESYSFLSFLGHECFHSVSVTGLTDHKGCSGAVVPCALLSQVRPEGKALRMAVLQEAAGCRLLGGCPQMALSCPDVCKQLALLLYAVLDETGSAGAMGHPILSSLHRRLLPGNGVP